MSYCPGCADLEAKVKSLETDFTNLHGEYDRVKRELTAAQASAAEAFNAGIEIGANCAESGYCNWDCGHHACGAARVLAAEIRSLKRTAPEPAGEETRCK